MIQNSRGQLNWDAAAVAEALHLTDKEAVAHSRDGRHLGDIIERIISRELNVRMTEHEGGHLLFDEDEQPWRVRRLTKGGVIFSPQSMQGTGRTFSAFDFTTFVLKHTGFIVADVETWPRVPYVAVLSDDIIKLHSRGYIGGGRMDREYALNAFFRERLF